MTPSSAGIPPAAMSVALPTIAMMAAATLSCVRPKSFLTAVLLLFLN
jgi:hypothetical protein